MFSAISKGIQLATSAIETARIAIVKVIDRVTNAIVALAEKVLVKFPQMQARLVQSIEASVAAAKEKLNTIANTLTQRMQQALNLYQKAVESALSLLSLAQQQVVNTVKNTVSAAVTGAKSTIAAMGAFSTIVSDIAVNPSAWLNNLRASASDGVQNHLWGAFSEQIQQWFNGKVELVLGLGVETYQLLARGGINLAAVGNMAWNALKSAIPTALVGVLMEKLVSMIVPAAGTVMLIVEGLQGVWGSLGQILGAFEQFISFLKSVRVGNAGPQFAAMIAAAGVAMVDFVSNWLLARLAKAASKVAASLKKKAQGFARKFNGKSGNQNNNSQGINLEKEERRGDLTSPTSDNNQNIDLKKNSERIKSKNKPRIDLEKDNSDDVNNRRNRRNKDKLDKDNKDNGKQKYDRELNKSASEDDKKDKLEKRQARIDTVKRKLENKLAKGAKKDELERYMFGLKQKYALKVLTLRKIGKNRFDIFGKINPEFHIYANQIEIINNRERMEFDPNKVKTYFRSVSILELKRMKKGGKLTVKTNKTGDPKGEFFISTNAGYSKDMITRRGNQPTQIKNHYTAFIEIQILPDTIEDLIESHGRVHDDIASRNAYPDLEPHQSGERGVLVVKLESNRGTDKSLVANYNISSKNPEDPNDPLYIINNKIISVTVTGGGIQESQLHKHLE